MPFENAHDAARARELAGAAPRGSERAQAPTPVGQIAAAIGNRGFSRTIARMRDGDGIMPGGVVHPDVEAAIVAARGTGHTAEEAVTTRVGSALGDSLTDVRIHTDAGAAELARSVSARAFTVGNDIFFGAGEYQPATPGGRELLTHELVHVVQQRGAPRAGRLTVSQPGDALEREAEDVARDI
ncbi:MAG TPA: DUF4157 domain-containing protein [Solirubrobacteraceae bacterium]|nr:DUF4157 domain-containing protein [Solirubrobacteraceae bacterium]